MMNILTFYEQLRNDADALKFSLPVVSVYNPLNYAWNGFEQYMKFSAGKKRVIFVGMNPGPYGMAKTGVPFGEINAVKNFLGITNILITKPENENPAYPVTGLECSRSEVSGRRLWGLFQARFGTCEKFFAEHFVLNYCPLLFIGQHGNYTPDKIKRDESARLFEICDLCLKNVVEALMPEFVIGIGNFAFKRCQLALKNVNVNITKILHPSPASPMANHGWSEKVTEQLITSGVWTS